ncbi:hypothetical protein B0H19DRAFT_1213662 [Mycena capillaripes]|nr:hypothetical protein B0H19DRAFT_1213662 [Mycena capillaripes]
MAHVRLADCAKNRVSTTSSSSTIQLGASERGGDSRRPIKRRKTLTPAQILLLKQDEEHKEAERLKSEFWIPVAPYFPTVVITLRALEVYRLTHLRCPRLGIQAFVRALCNIHGVAPRAWLGRQFSVVFDVHLAILTAVDRRVQVALGRDALDWRLKNACPTCMYKVEGEAALEIPFMCTMDGNNSLARFELCEREEVNTDGTTVPGASKERSDDRVAAGDYYLSRVEVDKWAKDGMGDLMKGFMPDVHGDDEGSGCTERWQNMKEDVTARAWGMYDETGIFPVLCRHGFVLVVVDMVKSGELSKYGFGVTAHLLRVLGGHWSRYDIGCKYGKMIKSHPHLSKLTTDMGFKSLVGAFHGHDHNRRCQLGNLTTYVKGVGLEPLEGCESFFSKSNALASTTRYATRFHWQYRRALNIKSTEEALQATMRELAVESRQEFEQWLEKEKAHLRTLSSEPLQETLEMEYYQKLVNLQDVEERVAAMLGVGQPFMPAAADGSYAQAVQVTRRLETQRRHTLEVQTKALAAVQNLELRLEVESRWVQGNDKWVATAAMVCRRRYQRALDHLEGLIVSQVFELGKCHMPETGYKLRSHIAKALQAHSKAVKTAITNYNTAAEAMAPQMPTLNWEQVVEYAFLSDFDLLREGREDIHQEPWALPAGCAAMDQHFKLLRTDEEIQRLNVEIRRLVTYIRDEDEFLSREGRRLREEGELALAHQVVLLRTERSRFTPLHMSRLTELSNLPGVSRERHTPVARDAVMRAVSPDAGAPPPAGDDQKGEGQGDEESEDNEDGSLTAAFMNIVRISHDKNAAAGDA